MDPSQFFRPGGTLPLESQSYIVRDADFELVDALEKGEYCYVLNCRQMGKSSLCVRAIERVKAGGARVAFIDLTKLGGRNVTPEQWYIGLLSEIGREIGLRAELVAHFKHEGDFSPLQRFFSALHHATQSGDGQLCIFVDEIDATRSLPFSTDEFFAGIRECFNRRVREPDWNKLVFCLIGVATPTELIRDPSTTPFNIGRRIELRDFTESEAEPLATGLGPSGISRLKRVLYWTGGHPYLTQAVCAEAAASPGEKIDAIVERMFFHAKARETNVNLADVQNRLLALVPEGVSPEEHRSAILDLYERVRQGKRSIRDDETDPLVALLKLCGLARVLEGYLFVRNRIYFRVFDRAWIRMNLPGAELERQRRAVRVATLRTATVGGGIVLAFGLLALNSSRLSVQARQSRDQAVALAREREAALESSKLSADNALKQTKRAEDALERLRKSTLLVKKSAAESLSQKIQALNQKSLAERNAREKDIEANKAKAATLKALASEEISRHNLREAKRNLRDSLRYTYVATMEAIQNADEARNYPLLSTLLDEAGKLPDRGWEWGFWHRQMNQQEFEIRAPKAVVTCNAFSRDGKLIATGFSNGQVLVSHTKEGSLLCTLSGHSQTILRLKFSPKSDALVSVSADGTAKSWIPETGDCVRTSRSGFQHQTYAEISPDGSLVCGLSATGAVRLYSTRSDASMTFPVEQGSLTIASFGPDGSHLALACYSKKEDKSFAEIWDLSSKTLEEKFPQVDGKISHAAISEDRNWLMTVGNQTQVWDIHSQQLLTEYTDDATGAAFSPDSKMLATTDSEGKVSLRDFKTGKTLLELEGEKQSVLSAEFSPDGKYLLCGGLDGIARIWDTKSGEILDELKGHRSWTSVARFSPDGQRVATISTDGSERVWRPFKGEPFQDLKGIQYSLLSPNGCAILIETGENVSKPTREPGLVAIYDAESGELKTRLPECRFVQTAAFTPDGSRLLTYNAPPDSVPGLGQDVLKKMRGVALWDLATGRLIGRLNLIKDKADGLFISPDAELFAMPISSVVRIMSLRSLTILGELRGHRDAVRNVRFSHDGKKILTDSEDKTSRIWDRRTLKCLSTFAPPNGEPSQSSFSSDGSLAISVVNVAGELLDFSAQVWDTTTGRTVTNLKSASSRNSSAALLSVEMAASDRTDFPRMLGASLSAEFSKENQVLTSSLDGVIGFWDPVTSKNIRSIETFQFGFILAKFFNDQKRILTAPAFSAGPLRIWEPGSGKCMFSTTIPQGNTTASGSTVLITQSDGSIRVLCGSIR